MLKPTLLLSSALLSLSALSLPMFAHADISQQQAANPNRFADFGTTAASLPTSVNRCYGTLLACAERVFSHQGEYEDTDYQLGKQIDTAKLFIYPQTKQHKPADIGIVVITESITDDDSIAGYRHRIAFIQKQDGRHQDYWQYISHRYQVTCARGHKNWSTEPCI